MANSSLGKKKSTRKIALAIIKWYLSYFHFMGKKSEISLSLLF